MPFFYQDYCYCGISSSVGMCQPPNRIYCFHGSAFMTLERWPQAHQSRRHLSSSQHVSSGGRPSLPPRPGPFSAGRSPGSHLGSSLSTSSSRFHGASNQLLTAPASKASVYSGSRDVEELYHLSGVESWIISGLGPAQDLVQSTPGRSPGVPPEPL